MGGIIPVFDQNDEQILALVLSAASPIVQQNQLFFDKANVQGKLAANKDEKFVSDLSRITVERQKSIDKKGADIGDLIEEEEPQLTEVAEEQNEDENTET